MLTLKDGQQVLTVRDAARILGKSEYMIRHLITNGRLQAQKIGKRWYTTPEAIQEAVDSGQLQRKKK